MAVIRTSFSPGERRDVAGPSPASGSHAPELDDDALLDLVQRQTLRYFWDFAHPACGLARRGAT